MEIAPRTYQGHMPGPARLGTRREFDMSSATSRHVGSRTLYSRAGTWHAMDGFAARTSWRIGCVDTPSRSPREQEPADTTL